MSDNYKMIFNGFLLVMIDINLGSFDLLPDVIGYLLVLSGLGVIYSKTQKGSFGIARYFAVWMVLSAGIDLVIVSFRLIDIGAFSSYVLMMFAGLGELILVVCIYQGMTAHMIMVDKTVLSLQLDNENKRYVWIQGLALITMSFSLNMPKDGSGVYVILLLVVGFIMHIRFLMNLSSVKKSLLLEAKY